MNAESFAIGDSLFHKRDVRVKVISASALSLVLALSTEISVAATGCTISAGMLLLSRPDPRICLQRIIFVNIFTIFLFITLPLSYAGDYLAGISIATLIAVKTNAILFCFLALIATSSATDIGHALNTLGMPTKLTFLFLFTYRQLFIIQQEYERLQQAARLRGFIPCNNMHTYRTYSHLFGMTLVKSWNRAERVHQAMLLRGFSGKLIPLNRGKPTRSDYLFLATLSVISFFLAFFSITPA